MNWYRNGQDFQVMIMKIENIYKITLKGLRDPDISFAQIGEITGRTENWARVTYYRGKEKLRKELDGNE